MHETGDIPPSPVSPPDTQRSGSMIHPYLRAFLALLPRYPRRALWIAWWWITHRRVRASAQLRMAVSELPDSYRLWLAIHQPANGIALHSDQPLLAVHLHLPPGQSGATAIESVRQQCFSRWEVYVTWTGEKPTALPDDPRILVEPTPSATLASALAQVLKTTQASYVIPLSPGSALTPNALAAYAPAVAADDVVLYADQDERDARDRRSAPWLKPAWDEDLFLAQDYLSTACAIPAAAARRIGVDPHWPDDVAIYALLARLLLGPAALPARHVPFVAVTTPAGTWSTGRPARRAIVQAATARAVSEGPFGTLNVHHRLPTPVPGVSVIVPTRDRLDLLQPCVEGLLCGTDYPAMELIIADNGSLEPETLAFFDRLGTDPRVRIVRWPHPYNYSAINNVAVAQAREPYICLLNNDIEMLDPSWLREMMAQAIRPGVGAVGARLLYPDHSLQHAGVVVGMGNAAGHAHRGLPKGEPGWFAQSLIARSATAVTAACLVVAKEKFDAVGGLDAENLAIAYNDVDLCLKLRAAGWRNIYAPQAVLIHHESKSRGLDFAPEHLARYMRELVIFQERWGTAGFQDPTHPPGLDPATEQYRLKL